MQELTPILDDIENKKITASISKIEYRNDVLPGMSIFFKNGIILSVITGEFSISNEKRPYEIAIIDDSSPNRDWMTELYDANDAGDSVIGYQTANDVMYYIDKITSFRA